MQVEQKERLERLVVEGGDEQALEELMREGVRVGEVRRTGEGEWLWLCGPKRVEAVGVADRVAKVLEVVGFDLQIFVGHVNSRYSLYMCGLRVATMYLVKKITGDWEIRMITFQPSESDILTLELDMQASGELTH